MLAGAGGHDLLMHPFGKFSMATRLPDAKVILYSDGGHGFLFQHAEDFGREIVDFLR